MGDRPGSSSRVRTSEDKVCSKDLCWYVRAKKLPDVSGPSLREAGCYNPCIKSLFWTILCYIYHVASPYFLSRFLRCLPYISTTVNTFFHIC